jgi:hypothetical protein
MGIHLEEMNRPLNVLPLSVYDLQLCFMNGAFLLLGRKESLAFK